MKQNKTKGGTGGGKCKHEYRWMQPTMSTYIYDIDGDAAPVFYCIKCLKLTSKKV